MRYKVYINSRIYWNINSQSREILELGERLGINLYGDDVHVRGRLDVNWFMVEINVFLKIGLEKITQDLYWRGLK